MKISKFKHPVLLACCIFILVNSCHKKDNAVKENKGPTPYIFHLPSYFSPVPASKANPMTNEGVYLGRLLYYDTLLSLGGPMQGKACASCHLQEKGFAMPGMAVLPHINLAWNKNFLWKGNVIGTMEDILQFEVNDFFAAKMENLKQAGKYQPLYKSTFGTEEITPIKTAYALAQFMRTLISSGSAYDQYLQGEKIMNPQEIRGYNLFFSEIGDCFHCHGTPLFTDNQFHNIGLYPKSSADMGRYLITGSSSDVGKFKTPTLRNVALRDVFMHDGRFKTLYDVLQHYNKGVLHNEFLDPLLDKPANRLSDNDIYDVIAFLNTLSDSTFIHNPELSKP